MRQNNEHDRIQPEAMKYKKLKGCADLSGQKYEYKMASLLLLRGVNHTDGFFLGSNVEGAGAFDDLLFKYRPKGELEYRTCFLQLKHKVKGNTQISVKDLADVNGGFCIYKYFKSASEVERNIKYKVHEKNAFFNIDLEKCDFVIYTNAHIDRELLAEEPISMTLPGAKILSTGTHDSNQPTVMKESILSDVKREVGKQLTKKNAKELKEFHGAIDSDQMKDFFGNLQWFSQQAKEDELDALIHAEIKMALETNEEDTIKVAKMFVEIMQSWWEEKELSEVLTETAQLWSDVIVSRLDLMNDAKRKEMEGLNISYTDLVVDSFNQSWSGKTLVNMMSQNVQLTSVKISQMLEKHHSKRFIFMDEASLLSRKPEVLRAWQSVWCDVLVIECSTDAVSLPDELCQMSAGKKLIFITTFVLPDCKHLRASFVWTQKHNIQWEMYFLSQLELPGYRHIRDRFCWSQLEPTSQNLLLDKNVDFQGCEVSMRSVVGELCTHALTGDVVTELLHPDIKLEIGRKLEPEMRYSVPRSLERSDYVTGDLFKQNSRDCFIISNVTPENLSLLETKYDIKLNKYAENKIEASHHFYWTDNTFNDDNFTRFHHKCSANVHWLSTDQSNSLYWKQSFDNTDLIKENVERSKKRTITEQDLQDVNDRVVLVTAEPGMGKTTYLKRVAQAAKETDSSLWVMQINLNDITRKLKERTRCYFRFPEQVTDFLVDVVTDCELDKVILKSRLTRTGNVNLFLDGLDEISPFYTDKIINMVQTLFELNIGQIWLTSRNIMQDHLEREFASICYSIKSFTDEEQSNFLVQYWSKEYSIEINAASISNAKNVLRMFSESFSETKREFTGIPLHCMMLGEVFVDDVRNGTFNATKRFDLLQLIEHFISKKLNILFEDKDQVDTSNARQIAQMEREKKGLIKIHSEAAIISLLSDEENQLLQSVDKNKMTERVIDHFGEGKEWTGVIDGMMKGRPCFVHRCFAEFFLAAWLSKNISFSTQFREKHLFEPRFVTVRHFFDRLLARDCLLHSAVLSADREAVAELLSSGVDVNHLDKEGRSALHLAASYPDNDPDFDNTDVGSIVQLLLDHGADVSLKDEALRWTPLRYADATNLWLNVEHLLKKGANTEDLVNMRDLITTLKQLDESSKRRPDYIRRRIETSCASIFYSLVERGCYHLLKFAVDERHLATSIDLTTNKNWTCISLLSNSEIRKCFSVIDPIYLVFEAQSSHVRYDVRSEMKPKLTLLHAAARSGVEDSVEFLMSREADTMQYDHSDMLPIHHAASAGRCDVIPLLLSCKGYYQINSRAQRKYTPLHYAARHGHLEAARRLVDEEARLEARTSRGETALCLAVLFKHKDVAKWLVEAGADTNYDGNTVMKLARKLGPEFTSWLTEHKEHVHEVEVKSKRNKRKTKIRGKR